MKVGRVTRDRSAPGRSWLMMCDRTLPCSESTTVSSVSESAGLSSVELLLLASEFFRCE